MWTPDAPVQILKGKRGEEIELLPIPMPAVMHEFMMQVREFVQELGSDVIAVEGIDLHITSDVLEFKAAKIELQPKAGEK